MTDKAGKASAEPKIAGPEPYLPKMTKAEAKQAVESLVGERMLLADYRPNVEPLTMADRELLIDQALLMLEQVYVHLPLKRAMHTTEPIQRLRLLRLRHEGLDERAFQSAMIDIFTDLRDLHTNYQLPDGYQSKFAFLPFRIEEFYDPDKNRKFAVTWVSPVATGKKLKVGAVVTHWNGSPIELAVARNAEREAGSNPEARRAQGVDALTLRWLGMSLPPDEDWVVLTFDADGARHEARFDWEIIDHADWKAVATEIAALKELDSAEWGIDLKTALLQRARTVLFDPRAIEVEQTMAIHRDRVGTDAESWDQAMSAGPAEMASDAALANTSFFPKTFPLFGNVDTPFGQFGYIRLRTFAPEGSNVSGAVREFQRLLRSMPPAGLILDVRGNGGGIVTFGEQLLQMLCPGPITPEPFHFLATALCHEMTRLNFGLGAWNPAIAQAIETGASFSQGFSLSSREACNSIGQIYQGPVVLITDALCYSTTDIFAAGFQDHGIGRILGLHKNTGAGGANVWTHQYLIDQIQLPANPFRELPRDAGMRVSIRRSTRVGERSGIPVEDLGVVPDELYLMTLRDLLEHNVELIGAAAKVLAAMPTQSLRLVRSGPASAKMLRYEVQNVDRLDVLVDDRPVISENVANGQGHVTLPAAISLSPGTRIQGNGYRQGKLVASTRVP